MRPDDRVTQVQGDSDRLPLPDASISHGSTAVSASLLLGGLLGAGQALLIAFIVGEGARTDAFFAAYALYMAFAIFGSTLRTSLIPLIGPLETAPGEPNYTLRVQELLSRVVLLGALIIGGLVLLSPVVGQLVTVGLPSYARWMAVFVLLVLAPAAYLQVLGAAQAAALMGAKRFYLSSAAYVIAGVVGVVMSAALLGALGVLGATIGLLAAAATFVLIQGFYLRRFGVRMRPRRSWTLDKRQRSVAAFLISASALAISQQLVLAVALGAVSSDSGVVTAYSYAFFAVAMVLTVSTLPLSLSTMPDLVADTARRGAAAARDYLTRVSPYGFAVMVPLLVAFAVDAKPLLQLVFDNSLSDGTIDTMYEVGATLCLLGIPASLVYLCSSVLLARHQARVFPVIAAVAFVLQLVLAVALSGVGAVAVAGGQVVAITVMAVLLLRRALGDQWLSGIAGVARRCAPAFGLALVIPLVRVPFGLDVTAAVAFACAVAGLLLYAVLVVVLWPGVSRAFIDMVRRAPA